MLDKKQELQRHWTTFLKDVRAESGRSQKQMATLIVKELHVRRSRRLTKEQWDQSCHNWEIKISAWKHAQIPAQYGDLAVAVRILKPSITKDELTIWRQLWLEASVSEPSATDTTRAAIVTTRDLDSDAPPAPALPPPDTVSETNSVTLATPIPASEGHASNFGSVLMADVFVGRGQDMPLISQHVEQHGVVLLYGQPGVGKSELAIQWGADSRYPTKYWVNCKSAETMFTSVRDLAMNLGLAPTGDRFGIVEHIFAQFPHDVLLILDNVSSDDDSARLINLARSKGHAVITSRTSPRRMEAFCYEVMPITEFDTQLLSTQLLPEQPTSEIETLAERLKGEPLAVWTASAFIDDTEISINRFVSLLDSSSAYLLGRHEALGSERPSLTAIWEEALSVIDQRSGVNSRIALCAIRLLGGQQIPKDVWITAIAFAYGSNSELADESSVRGLAASLTSLRLVRDTSGWIQGHSLLLDYVWQTSDTQTRTQAFLGFFLGDKLILQHYRSNLDADALSLVPALWEAANGDWPPSMAQIIAETLTLAATYCTEQDVESWALAFAELALKVVDEDNIKMFSAAVASYVSALVELHKPAQASRFVESIIDRMQTETPVGSAGYHEGLAGLHLSAARAAWADRDVESSLFHGEEALQRARLCDPNQADTIIVISAALFCVGQAQFASREYEAGSATLLSALDCLPIDVRWNAFRRSLRAESADLHRRHSVNVPESLLESNLRPPNDSASGDGGQVSRRTAIAEASALIGAGDYAAGKIHLRRELRTFSDTESPLGIIREAELRQHLARAAIDSGEIPEALMLLEPTLVQLRETPGAPQGLLAGVLINLASAYAAEASEYRKWPKTNGETSTSNYGQKASDLLARAFTYASEAIKIDRVEVGEQHSEYAHDASTLGGVLFLLDRRAAALKWLNVAINIWSAPGPSHDEGLGNKTRILRDAIQAGM